MELNLECLTAYSSIHKGNKGLCLQNCIYFVNRVVYGIVHSQLFVDYTSLNLINEYCIWRENDGLFDDLLLRICYTV